MQKWLNDKKTIANLLSNEKLAARGVVWVNQKTSKTMKKECLATYKKNNDLEMGYIWVGKIWEACCDLASGLEFIAALPEINSIQQKEPSSSGLFYNNKDPNHLLFAPSTKLPPILWIKIPATEKAILEAISWFHPQERLERHQMPKHIRAGAGLMNHIGIPNVYTGEMQAADAPTIQNFWIFNNAIGTPLWGNAYVENPYVEIKKQSPDLFDSPIGISSLLREFNVQEPDILPRLNYCTSVSHSFVSLEIHPHRNYVWDIKYRPSPFKETIRSINELSGHYSLPEDLPIDVAAMIWGFSFIEEKTILSQAQEELKSDNLFAILEYVSATYGDTKNQSNQLRKWLHNADQNIVDVTIQSCISNNYMSLLCELIAEGGRDSEPVNNFLIDNTPQNPPQVPLDFTE